MNRHKDLNTHIAFLIVVVAAGMLGPGRPQAVAAPLLETGILAGPAPQRGSPRYVCLARLPNADLLAVFSGFPGDADQTATWSCYSTDSGKTWSEPIVAVDTPGVMDADPNLVVCQDRVLAVATTRKAAELIWTKFPFSTSYDDGRTWRPGGVIDHYHRYSSGKLQAATRLQSGRLLLPFCWDRILEQPGGKVTGGEAQMISNAAVLYSDDDGHEWKKGGDVNISGVPGGGGINGLDETCLAELADGSVFALCRTGVDRLYETRSADQGVTWSKPKPSPLVASNAPASMTALDQPKGAVVVVWNETAKGDRKPLAAAYSTDQCRSWSKSKIVFDGYSPYPSIVQAADGTIVAAWFQKTAGGTAIGFARFNWDWLTAGNS